jgi:hypothetical protein
MIARREPGMSDEDRKRQEREIEHEIRRRRKFTLAEVIGREGGGFFKGESPVPMLARAIAGLTLFIERHVPDSSGALRRVLERRIRDSETIVGKHFDDPLAALEIIVDQMLSSDARLYEIVRQVDVEWGRLMLERPHFQKPGQDPHPDDEHTHESVRAKLEALRGLLRETE